MPVVFFWPSVIWSVTVHLVLVPAAEGVGADIKMEVVTNSVEISTSDSVPTIGSLVSFEEGTRGKQAQVLPPQLPLVPPQLPQVQCEYLRNL